MSTAFIPPHSPSSPGIAMRRKGPKVLPRLPLSAFSPPNSGTSEAFPLAPSPSTVHPEHVIDSHVVLSQDNTVESWKSDAGDVLAGRSGGIVVVLQGDSDQLKDQVAQLNESSIDILSVAIPFKLDDPSTSSTPIADIDSKYPKSLTTTLTQLSPAHATKLKWALEQEVPVDIDVQIGISDASLESFEEMITTATTDLEKSGPIILSNILPPPHDLTLPIVKLMQHPMYRAFQAQTAALSLFPRTYVKFLPPSWDAPTPPTPPAGASVDDLVAKQKREWKRRIKMFLGPVIEAFGYQRIIFGSSPSPSSKCSSHAGDWYEIARESLAELGMEQEAIDAVFYENAKKVYTSA